ncbi:MAG: threonine synthase [Gammaproteobacteria bacterium]|nr:threonine synthase [Gammaproteobacteria bacterium]
MRLYNIRHPEERVDFAEAVLRGIGRDGGLFFPENWPRFGDVPDLLALDFVSRSAEIAERLLGEVFSPEECRQLVADAFDFPLPLVPVAPGIYALELFHGPTLAFKDFGARFMARVLSALLARRGDAKPVTILSATSGDTGAAVAHAFYGLPGIEVVILFPKGRIAPLQEKLFTTLGGNIRCLAVDGDFDACQALVKAAFADPVLVARRGLNSANSINIARLLAQCFYYFEAVAQAPRDGDLLVSVPSGNIGNLTAGLLAQRLGLPIAGFVAATNANDTVPRYLDSGVWQVRPTVATLSNAMDVSAPNNWPRVEELFAREHKGPAEELRAEAFDEAQTIAALRELHALDYLAEPHGAIAYAGLKAALKPGQQGLFLCTAHPAKFQDSVESLLDLRLDLPAPLARLEGKPGLEQDIAADDSALRAYLLEA